MSLIISSKLTRLRASALMAALVFSLGASVPASAVETGEVLETNISHVGKRPGHELQTSNSGTVWFSNGQPLSVNAWIQPVAKGGCGSFSTSAVMNVSPQWIKNTTSFYQIGVGSLSIGSLNLESSRAGGNTLTWTNNNGAKGSYLHGSVCGGWGALYVGMDVSASAFYNGSSRVASTRI